MSFFKNRPFALFCCSFCAAVAAAELLYVSVWNGLWIAADLFLLFLLFAAVLLFSKNGERAKTVALSLAITSLAGALGFFCHWLSVGRIEADIEKYVGREEYIECIAGEEVYFTGYSSSYSCTLKNIGGNSVSGKIKLLFENDTRLSPGERIRVKAVIIPLREETDGFPERRYYRSEGVLFAAEANSGEKAVRYGTVKNAAWLIKLRGKVSERIDLGADLADGGICKALFTGDRSGISDGVSLALSRAGISHLLAISGMHLSMLVGGAELLLRMLRVHRSVRCVLLFAVAAMYCGAAGFSYSVLRAAIMLVFVYAAYFFGRERDIYTALFASCALILLVTPYAASSCALWLSVFSTFGVVAGSELVAIKIKKPKSLWDRITVLLYSLLVSLTVGLCASVCSLPVTWLVFGRISVFSPIATVLCGFLAEILLFCSVVFAIAGMPVPVISRLASFVSSLLLEIAEKFSDVKGAALSLAYPFAPFLIAAVLLFALWLLFGKKKRVAVCMLALSLVCYPTCAAVYNGICSKELRVSYGSYGNSDLLAFPSAVQGCGAVVFDLSAGFSRSARYAESAADKLCRTEIDLLVITRLNSAAARMIEKTGASVKLRKVLLPIPESKGEEEYAALARRAAGKVGAECGSYSYNTPFTVGDTEYYVYAPYVTEYSTVPVRAIKAKRHNTSLFYLSSGGASSPGVARYAVAASNTDVFIFGAAGPKNTVPLDLKVNEDAVVVLPSREYVSYAGMSVARRVALKTGKVLFVSEPQVISVPLKTP